MRTWFSAISGGDLIGPNGGRPCSLQQLWRSSSVACGLRTTWRRALTTLANLRGWTRRTLSSNCRRLASSCTKATTVGRNMGRNCSATGRTASGTCLSSLAGKPASTAGSAKASWSSRAGTTPRIRQARDHAGCGRKSTCRRARPIPPGTCGLSLVRHRPLHPSLLLGMCLRSPRGRCKSHRIDGPSYRNRGRSQVRRRGRRLRCRWRRSWSPTSTPSKATIVGRMWRRCRCPTSRGPC
mmetsp:Transcript_48229/g.140555  ORF Transcript_48229/g.140555 Transcript_48229/m.140555 type:complete len:239 (+) Transcript_48229:242-958(+)